jgi:DNA repair protein RecN (Recombination protein N)
MLGTSSSGIRALLSELRVENYAVIDQAVVEFASGLNLLTGETGAGKSILIDALALLLGDKASPDVIRHGCEKAVISCVFELTEGSGNAKRLHVILEANGIDCESNELILRREVAAGGKGRVFINNQPATVSVLRQLAPELAVVHAQNETVMAFENGPRLRLLDRFAGIATEELAERFGRVRGVRAKIADLERDEQDRLRLVDLWSFQSKEIADARLEAGEDTRLETEKRVLANAEKLYAAAMSAYDALYEGQSNAAALMRAAEKQVEELSRFDARFTEQLQGLRSARASVEDAGTTLRDYAEGISASPERLAEIEDRLALLDRLKRKYGATLEEVITFGADSARKLNEVENRDEVLKQLKKELAAASAEYLQSARAVSRKRYDAAKKLEKMVEREINELAMKASFKIEMTGSDEEGNWAASGFDSVAYLIATNAGEPLKPIEQIASGGELSRVMLSLKATVEEGRTTSSNGAGKKKSSGQRTMVFDEVDAGIGGRAAEAVGKKLKALSRNTQVLCITHLPQIASFADRHFVIEKREAAGRTKTSVRILADRERTEEIARMLSGAKLTDTSLKHAEQMLKANA